MLRYCADVPLGASGARAYSASNKGTVGVLIAPLPKQQQVYTTLSNRMCEDGVQTMLTTIYGARVLLAVG